MKKGEKYRIILENGIDQMPYRHELAAASIMADYFESDVMFLRRTTMSSPDLIMVKTHQIWELKSPLGGGRRTKKYLYFWGKSGTIMVGKEAHKILN